MVNDISIIEHVWPNNIRFIKRLTDNEKQYLINRFDDSQSIEETLYRIKYNIYIRPVCKKCGNPVKFNKKNTFNLYCSASCRINQQAIKTAIKIKYNVDNISQLQFVKDKVKQTVLAKYGVKNSFNLGINKSIETRQKKSDNVQQKRKQTCLNKYGVDNVQKSNIIKEKQKINSILKYGTPYPHQNIIIRKKLSESIKRSIPKRIETLKNNNSFNKSLFEDNCYDILKEKYPDVVRQYRDVRYPFNCDFYIPSKDLFIEIQGTWTHGGKPFEGTLDDLLQLQNWCEKNTKYYDNAIDTWCIRDVKKRKIALQNGINYIEIWNLNEIYKI